MKDRITRAKALLDLAQLISSDADIGILVVAGGPNGVISASVASILDIDFRLEGEDASKRPAIIPFVGKIDGQRAFQIVDAARDAAAGSILIVQSEKVERDAEILREFVANLKNRQVIVATCHS